MAISKEKSWFVYDKKLLDAAWSDFTVADLLVRVEEGSLLDADQANQARRHSKDIDMVRWLGPSYLGTYKSRKEAEDVERELNRELIEAFQTIKDEGGADKSLWEFYSSRWFYERWFSRVADEIELDYALMVHLTYTGVKFQEKNFHNILVGPCQDKKLLRRNVIQPNVLEVPPLEQVGYNPDFQDAVLQVTESYLRDRITRAEHADPAWQLVSALQISIRFAREHGLDTYITGDQELTIAPDLDFTQRQELHRRRPPSGPKPTQNLPRPPRETPADTAP